MIFSNGGSLATENTAVQPSKELIDEIYREKVLRARQRSPEDKFFAGAKLFSGVCERMEAGLRQENPTADDQTIRELLERRLVILRRLRERDGR
jgi:hypothetical protein